MLLKRETVISSDSEILPDVAIENNALVIRGGSFDINHGPAAGASGILPNDSIPMNADASFGKRVIVALVRERSTGAFVYLADEILSDGADAPVDCEQLGLDYVCTIATAGFSAGQTDTSNTEVLAYNIRRQQNANLPEAEPASAS